MIFLPYYIWAENNKRFTLKQMNQRNLRDIQDLEDKTCFNTKIRGKTLISISARADVEK